jgi:hypothetical protein
MKNVINLDIKLQFIPHRRHLTSSQQSTASNYYVRFEVLTGVIMKNTVFWDARRVALVKTDVSKEFIASIIKVGRVGELQTSLAVTSNRSTL